MLFAAFTWVFLIGASHTVHPETNVPVQCQTFEESMQPQNKALCYPDQKPDTTGK